MKKGFVLTIDTMLALVVATLFITMIVYFVTTPKLKTQEYLYSVGGDFLAVLEKDGSLVAAVNGHPAGVEYLIGAVPANLCLNITITNATDHRVYSGGGCPEAAKYVIAKRTLINGSDFYVVKARVWYR